MNYIQISIKATELEQEVLISQLSDLNSTGFEQQPDLLLAFFNENDFQKNEIEHILKNFSSQITLIPEQNWNAVWESNFQPVVVDDFCAIRAHFHEPVPTVQNEIIITPKMSFGTGHHATTFMMIEQMRPIDFNHKSVFDFGTGTGILSILAEKLGASNGVAIDVDEWSITNAKENFERNSSKRFKLYKSSHIPEQKFDIILANINKNVLLQYMPSLKKSLKPAGILILSGLLKEDAEDIERSCNSLNLKCKNKIERQNWISQRFEAE